MVLSDRCLCNKGACHCILPLSQGESLGTQVTGLKWPWNVRRIFATELKTGAHTANSGVSRGLATLIILVCLLVSLGRSLGKLLHCSQHHSCEKKGAKEMLPGLASSGRISTAGGRHAPLTSLCCRRLFWTCCRTRQRPAARSSASLEWASTRHSWWLTRLRSTPARPPLVALGIGGCLTGE